MIIRLRMPGPEDRHGDQQQDDRREAHHDVDDAHDHEVGPAGSSPAIDAEDRPDQRREDGGDQPDSERDAPADERPSEHVAPVSVGPEPVLRRRRLVGDARAYCLSAAVSLPMMARTTRTMIVIRPMTANRCRRKRRIVRSERPLDGPAQDGAASGVPPGSPSLPSVEPDARIGDRVGDVREEVRHQDRDCDDQAEAHDHREVATAPRPRPSSGPCPAS